MKEKTVSEAITYRRSVRIYDPEQTIATEKVKHCIEQATLAPTSSNLQLWEFYHITSPEIKKTSSPPLLQPTCSQNGARVSPPRSALGPVAKTHSIECGVHPIQRDYC